MSRSDDAGAPVRLVDEGSPPAARRDNRRLTEEENNNVRQAAQRLRQQLGGVTALAERLGVSQPMLSTFMNGRTGAGLRIARAVAHALGMSVDDLLSGEGHPYPRVGDMPEWARWEAEMRATFRDAPESVFLLAQEWRGPTGPVLTRDRLVSLITFYRSLFTEEERIDLLAGLHRRGGGAPPAPPAVASGR